MIKKLIITNGAVLKKKYKAAGWKKIQQALDRLAAADARRGITNSLALLDRPTAGIPKAANPRNEKQCKAAMDALYKKHASPDYVMILGAADVVPHQTLQNPVAGRKDPDEDLPSDLPYACDAPYSKIVGDFVGPTRVVGRLPDQPGADQVVDQLVALIDSAAKFAGTSGKKTFVLSAAVWKSATKSNVKRAFGSAQTVAVCPPKGPQWPARSLKAPLHFINCHGASDDPNYYGEPGNSPVAYEAGNLAGVVAKGAVVAAECCYGAQLYDLEGGVPVGIATTYLNQGAIAFCGSTNVAYGAALAVDRCNADILCTDFMSSIMRKGTTGRALLEARQAYVGASGNSAPDPIDLKTLGQFLLLGDPSIRPYGGATSAPVKRKAVKSAKARPAAAVARGAFSKTMSVAAHKLRRRNLKAAGAQLTRDTPIPVRKTGGMPAAVRAVVARTRGTGTVGVAETLQFEVRAADAPKRKTGAVMKARSMKSAPIAMSKGSKESIFVVFSEGPVAKRSPARKAKKSAKTAMRSAARAATFERASVSQPGIVNIQATVVRMSNGKVVSYKSAWSKSRARR